MKYNKYILIILSLFVLKILPAQNVLNKYLESAAINNPKLQTEFNEYLAALEVVPQQKALPDPQLAFGYFIKAVETRNGPQEFRISVSQMFPWIGTLKAKENASIQAAKAKYEMFEDSKSELYYNVRSAYYNLYYTQETIEIISDNIEILETFRKLALIKIETGKASAVDELRVKMELADLENNLLLQKDILNVQKVLFNNLINVDSESEIVIEKSFDAIDLSMIKEAILDSIISRNHQLKKLDFQFSSLRYKEIASQKMGMPSFSLGMDYISIGTSAGNFSGEDAFMFPKVGINIPLYRNKYKAMVDEVVYLKKAKTFEKQDRVNMLESIFENSWKNYQDASRRIDHYGNQGNLAKQAITLLESTYATQGVSFEEILRMERKVLSYSLAHKKAISDQYASVAFMYYLMGNN